jgi:hypothetical protein
VESPSTEGMSTSFTIETLDQLDAYLTSDTFVHATQLPLLEDSNVLETYYAAVEDSLAVGNDCKDKEIESFNVLVVPALQPIGVMTVELVQGQHFRKPLRVLFDSGTSRTLFSKQLLPSTVKTHKLKKNITMQTGNGVTELAEV